MSLTGRPSRPPLALVSSSQIFMPSSACLPKPASGPVSAMPKPILIGSPDWACAGAARARAIAQTAAKASNFSLDRSITHPPRVKFYGILGGFFAHALEPGHGPIVAHARLTPFG